MASKDHANPILTGSLRSKNISEVIIERFVSSIISGELRPGERLPSEEEFAERLGVGRSSVREAMKILEAMGIIEIRRADGTYVVDELNERMLNPLVLGMLVAEKSAEDVCTFKALVQNMAFEILMMKPTEGQFDGCISRLDAIEREESWRLESTSAQLIEAETALAEAVSNPLVRILYKRTILIASNIQIQLLKNNLNKGVLRVTTFLRDAIAALERQDRKTLRQLLEDECSWMLSGTN